MHEVNQTRSPEAHQPNGVDALTNAAHASGAAITDHLNHKSGAQVIASLVKGASNAASTARHTTNNVIETLDHLVAVYHSVTASASKRVLDRLGLQRRTSWLATGGTFAAGVAVGVTGGLLLAPMSGLALRKKLYTAAQSLLESNEAPKPIEPTVAVESAQVAAPVKSHRTIAS
jgi:hypothetical protein